MEKLYLEKLKSTNEHFKKQYNLFQELFEQPTEIRRGRILNTLYDNLLEEMGKNLEDLKRLEESLKEKKDVWIILDGIEPRFLKAARDYFKKRYPQFTYVEGDHLDNKRAKFLWYFMFSPTDRVFLRKSDLINRLIKEKRVEKVVVLVVRNTKILTKGFIAPSSIPRLYLDNDRDFAFQFAFMNRIFWKDRNKDVMEKFEEYLFE